MMDMGKYKRTNKRNYTRKKNDVLSHTANQPCCSRFPFFLVENTRHVEERYSLWNGYIVLLVGVAVIARAKARTATTPTTPIL